MSHTKLLKGLRIILEKHPRIAIIAKATTDFSVVRGKSKGRLGRWGHTETPGKCKQGKHRQLLGSFPPGSSKPRGSAGGTVRLRVPSPKLRPRLQGGAATIPPTSLVSQGVEAGPTEAPLAPAGVNTERADLVGAPAGPPGRQRSDNPRPSAAAPRKGPGRPAPRTPPEPACGTQARRPPRRPFVLGTAGASSPSPAAGPQRPPPAPRDSPRQIPHHVRPAGGDPPR